MFTVATTVLCFICPERNAECLDKITRMPNDRFWWSARKGEDRQEKLVCGTPEQAFALLKSDDLLTGCPAARIPSGEVSPAEVVDLGGQRLAVWGIQDFTHEAPQAIVHVSTGRYYWSHHSVLGSFPDPIEILFGTDLFEKPEVPVPASHASLIRSEVWLLLPNQASQLMFYGHVQHAHARSWVR